MTIKPRLAAGRMVGVLLPGSRGSDSAQARVVLAAVAVVLLSGLGALPATADTGSTDATVVVTGGALRITAPGDAGVLGTRHFDASSGNVRGALGSVKVSDTRGAAPGSGWVASVVSTPLKGPGKAVIPAGAVGYSVGKITQVGDATYRPVDANDISKLVPVITATDVSGNNTATWNPTIVVRVPAGTRAGTYAITVTHSVI